MAHDPSAFIQEYFQIRSGDTEGLNADTGWAAGENTNATIGTGIPFRIRFKVRETAAGSDSTGFKLQVNRNSSGWVDVDILDGTTVPATLAILSSIYADGDLTDTELLTNTGTYVDGEGLEDNTSASYSLSSEETEFEWCLMIMGFHENFIQNVVSDTLDFRVVESDGTVFTGTYTNPTITVSETPGYIGGAFVESPGDLLHVDTNGNIYTLIEGAHVVGTAEMVIIKSTDGGDTWRPQDHANRPTVNDIESVHIFKDGDTLHILLQDGDEDVTYHTFRMSDHASADTWGTTDESVATTTSAGDQGCGLVIRSDGDKVAAYRYFDGTNDRVGMKVDTGGGWGSEVNVDDTASTNFVFSGIALDGDDITHIFYHDVTNWEIFHKSVDPSDDSLSGRESIETDSTQNNNDDWGAVGVINWADGADEKVMVVFLDDSDKFLYSVLITNDGSPDARKQANSTVTLESPGTTTSRQIVGDLVVDLATKVAYLLYVDASTADLWRDESDNDGGWGTDVELLDDKIIDWVRGNVFTHSGGNGGATVYGYIYDNGSDGGTGLIYYDEYVISVPVVSSQSAYLEGASAGTPVSDSQPVYLKGQDSATDSQLVYLAGQDTASDNQVAYLSGALEAIDNQPAYLAGQDIAIDNQPAYLAGGLAVVDSQAAYLEGIASAVDNQPAYLAGGIVVSDNQPAYLAGQDTTLDNQPVYLTGVAGASSSQPVYLSGQDTAVDNQSAYLAGQDTALDNQPAYLAGGINVTDNQFAYLAGQDTAIDSQPAYLAGGINVTSSQAAYLQGDVLLASSSQSAYLSGQDSALDNQLAYLKGQDTTLDSQPAYLTGGIVVSDNQTAYLAGQDFAADSQPAYLAGGVVVSDNQPAYLSGVAGAVDNQPAYLAGGLNVIDSQVAYLSGQDIAVDNQSAYLAGGLSVTSSQSVYLSGQDTAIDSQPAYLAGGLDVSDNQPAYLAGQDTALDNQITYLAGQDMAFSSVPAYMMAGLAASSSQPAYIAGAGTAVSSSQSAYLDGRPYVWPFSDDFTGTDNDPIDRTKWVTSVS